jgi:hypothetical protein
MPKNKTTDILPRNYLVNYNNVITSLSSEYYTIAYIQKEIQKTCPYDVSYQVVRDYMKRNQISNLKADYLAKPSTNREVTASI